MTREQIAAMPADEVERRLHEALGHCWHPEFTQVTIKRTTKGSDLGWQCNKCKQLGLTFDEFERPPYCADTPEGHFAAHGLGQVMRERGLGERYAEELLKMIEKAIFGLSDESCIPSWEFDFETIFAKPDPRARAALWVLMQNGNGKEQG